MKANRPSLLKYIQFTLALILTLGSAKAQFKADFTANITAGCSPIIVNFRDSSTGNPTSWKWDLGNGTISFLQNPAVSYTNSGSYTIKLIISNETQKDTITKTQYITVYDNPTVNFSALTTQGCYPLHVQLTDLSTANSGNISQWQWDFGDGNVSTTQSPLHIYSTEGNFDVKLKVTNSYGCTKTLGKSAFIKVEGGLHADFSHAVAGNCTPPTPVAFTNASTGTGGTLNYQWWFGDGTISTDVNPVHVYNAQGSYTVTLITKNTYGCTDTVIRTNSINIGAVQANFAIPQTICAGTTLNITNTSTPATVYANWSFGDGTFSSQTNPSKLFSTPGNYTIKLVNNFGACTDSISKNILVLAKPTASFNAINNIACTAPLNVQFINSSMGGESYQWNFGNGNTSTLQSPTQTFSSLGNYTVNLVVTASNGCKDSIAVVDFVKISAPKISSIDRTPKEGCVPLTVHTSAVVSSVQNINSYQWSFGDGSFSSSITPTHIYTTEGNFTLQLVITTVGGCSDSLSIIDAVKVGHKPTANFIGTPRDVCPTSGVFFTDSSTNGPIDKWLWSFGDGKGSNVQNPITTYSDTGYKNVKLIVWNNGCSDTIVKGAYIHVKPPIAAFNQTMNDCTNKLKVTFTDASKGAVTYLWDFGDGNTSTLPSPVHIYAASGVYLVTLSVFNGDCGHSKSRQIAVDDNNGILRVSSSVICRNSNVTFSIDSLNTAIPANYNWYIGTGSLIPTTVANLSNVYTQTGNYPVRVIILYSNGCRDTLTSNDGVKVYGPTASFKPAAQQYCSGNTVNFIDSSITDGTHSITNWNWNYGDGNIVNYTSAPFTHQYNSGNAFGVLLKVTDAFGCSDSIYKANAVIVSKSTAAFIETDTLVCPGTTVQFTSQSVGNNLAHQWDLGDGTVSSLVNPSHSYNQGTYTVKLSVVDPLGCSDTLIKINRIQVYNPVAQFLLSDSTAVCPPLLVNMVNNSIHAGTSTWTFGDGSGASLTNPSHMYTYPGNYSVKLVVRNTGGCADSATKHVFINGPTGTLTYMPLTACNPVLVSFSALTQNTVKNIWDFNDGVVNTTTANTTTHTYTLAGHYIPKLILEDATGCRVPIIGKDTIGVKEIKAYIANPYRTICDSASVLFSDSSRTNDIITNYAWKFGDGFYSTQPQPYHVYNTNGLYTVQLHVTTLAGCTDSISYVQAIKVVSSPKATVLGDTVVCKNGSLLFTANRINADTSIVSWHWNFGNGAAANVQNPPAQVYSTAGNFNLVNTITNSSGCFSTITKSIIVHDLPNLNAGIDTAICRNQSYNLSATGAASYTWSGNTSTLSCTTCANPIAKPLTTITYALTGRNAFNCIATDSVTITVQQPLKLTVVKADTICLGSTATIKASGTEKYTWYPTLYIDNPNKAEVNIHPAKDTLMNYMLVGKDNRNCFSDTNYVKVKAYPIPKMEINQAEITINAGSSIKLQTTNSGDVTKWKWTPNKYLDNANSAEPTMIAKESITYVCVAANDGNCVTRDEVKIVVVCNSGNIFVPNTFSPNGDGNNDVFYPRGKGVYTIKNLRIFNRWGETVFERSNFQANDVNSGWDGTYKGVKLASDAYVYSLEIMCDNNTIVPSKGSITLIR